MINIATLLNNIVDSCRMIPDLVTAVGGDEANIRAYHDQRPSNLSLMDAVAEMPSGGVLVAYNGSSPAPSRMGSWSHSVCFYVQAPNEAFSSAPDGFHRIIRNLFDGVPLNGICRMRDIQFMEELDPMSGETVQRISDPQGLDLFEVRVTFVENTL